MGNQSSEKIEYMIMVQTTISRMSSTSAILKGFAATVVTGISAISFTDVNKWVLMLSVLPVVSFCILDIYYLWLERKFRYMFNLIRRNETEINFSMDVMIPNTQKIIAKCRWYDLIRSPSIWVFYLPAITVVALVVTMKFGGVL